MKNQTQNTAALLGGTMLLALALGGCGQTATTPAADSTPQSTAATPEPTAAAEATTETAPESNAGTEAAAVQLMTDLNGS